MTPLNNNERTETEVSTALFCAYGDDQAVLRIMYDRLRRHLERRMKDKLPAAQAEVEVSDFHSSAIPPLEKKAKSLASYAKVVCGLIDMVTYLSDAEVAAKRGSEGTPEDSPSGMASARPAPCDCQGAFLAQKETLQGTISAQRRTIEDKDESINEHLQRISQLSTELQKAQYQNEHNRFLTTKYKEKCDELEKLKASKDKNEDTSWLTSRMVAEIKKQEELQSELARRDALLGAKDEQMQKLTLVITNRNEKIKGLLEQVDQLERTLDDTSKINKHPLDPYAARRLLIERPPCAQSPLYEASPEQDEDEVAEAVAEGRSSVIKRLDGNLRAIVAQWPGILATPPFNREELSNVIGFYYPCGQAPPREWYMLSEHQISRGQGTRMPREMGCQIGNDRHEPYRIMLDDLREMLTVSGLRNKTPIRRARDEMEEDNQTSADRLYMVSGSRNTSPDASDKDALPAQDLITTIDTTPIFPADFIQDDMDRLAEDRERRVKARRALHVVLPRDLPVSSMSLSSLYILATRQCDAMSSLTFHFALYANFALSPTPFFSSLLSSPLPLTRGFSKSPHM